MRHRRRVVVVRMSNENPIVRDFYKLAFDGMTLRDYFAAKAMQGICASRDEAGVLIAHGYEWTASEAYKIADAMLEARK